jgi:hypothetical protein
LEETMTKYDSMRGILGVDRRRFLKGLGTASAVAAGGAVLGVPPAYGEEKKSPETPPKVETNIDDFMKVPKGPGAIPGPFPGKVVQVVDPASMQDGNIDADVVRAMLEEGIGKLTGKSPADGFKMLFTTADVVGLKVNPVGPPFINTTHELTEAVVRWLVESGLPTSNVVIWDRFDAMLEQGGYTSERYPGVRIASMQTMDEKGDSWRGPDGRHVSEDNFDMEAYYFVKDVVGKGVPGYKDDEFYLNQHVFNGEYSYFGKLVTKELTKIINLPVFKNTAHGISMATKNIGYAACCNVGRLHMPLFFDVCTEVTAAPWVRDKLALNITDGIRGQYEGGPGGNAQFVYPNHSLYLATDPFALDMVCHNQMVAKRKEMKITVNEHPRFSQYLHYGEQLGLGVADTDKIDHVVVKKA